MPPVIAEWRERLRPSGFVGQVMVLASGASVAQAIGLLAAPVLTRLYTPADFGVYALYVAVLAIASPLVSGRYELAVVPAESENESLDLLIVAAMLALAAGGLVLLLLVFARSSIFGSAGLGSLLPFWWLIPVGVVLTGVQQAARYLMIRHKRFPRISGSDITQAAVGSGAQIALAVQATGAWGMLAGQVAGMLASTCALTTAASAEIRGWRGRHSGSVLSRISRAMSKYRSYPVYLPWGGLLDALGQRLPVLLLSGYYGPGFLGVYAVAERLLRAPASLLAQASSQVLFTRMTESGTKARMSRVLWRWSLGVAAVSFVPLLLLHFWGEPVFGFVLGEQWQVSGKVAARLAPYIVATLIVSPPSTLLLIANRQGVLLLMQLLFCAGGFGALWLTHVLGYPPLAAVSAFALVQCGVYAVYFAVLLRVSRQLTQAAGEANPCAA